MNQELSETLVDSINSGGSLGDILFKMPEFNSVQDLINYLKNNRGYDYSNSFSNVEYIKGKYVAEMGCGHGYISIALSSEAERLDGFDVDSDAIERAIYLKKRYSIRNINFFVFDGYNTNMPSNSYDVVLSADVLEHVPNPKRYLTECYRVLKDKGVLVLTTPNGLIAKKDERIIKSHSPYHITEFYPSELENMLTSNNFKILKIYRKLDIVTNGYRLSRIRKCIYKLSSSKLISKASKIKSNLIKGTEQSQPDSYANYRLIVSSINNITDKNCDVIVVVAIK
jgi:2-polyprenyl-3-methyl-5-hydroxy-6-metoxy-1,4-benzoquinol methylase